MTEKSPATRLTNCRCSDDCQATTKAKFAPGHDARMVGRLARAVAAGELTVEQAEQQVRLAGGSDILAIKVRNSAKRQADKAKRSGPAKSPHLAGEEVKVAHGKRTFKATVTRNGQAQHQLGKTPCTHQWSAASKSWV